MQFYYFTNVNKEVKILEQQSDRKELYLQKIVLGTIFSTEHFSLRTQPVELRIEALVIWIRLSNSCAYQLAANFYTWAFVFAVDDLGSFCTKPWVIRKGILYDYESDGYQLARKKRHFLFFFCKLTSFVELKYWS